MIMFLYFLAGVFFGISMVLRKIGGQKIGPFNMAIIEPATASLIALTASLVGVLGARHTFNAKGVGIGIASGVCLSIALISLFYGLMHGLTQTGTAITFAMTIIVGVLLSIIFLSEPVSWQRLIGFGLIVGGIVVTMKG